MKNFPTQIIGLTLLSLMSTPLAAQSFLSEDRAPVSLTGFGRSLAVSDQEIMVGESQNTYQGGFVFIYSRTGDGWEVSQRLEASDGEWGDRFGTAIDVDGNTMVVTGDGPLGAAYVFERERNGRWREVAKLTGSDVADGDNFGLTARVSGDYVMVGAERSDSIGAVYVFRRSGRNWSEVAKLRGGDSEVGDRFGTALDLDGDKALIAARGHDEQRGAVYFFQLNEAGEWVEQGTVGPEDLEEGDQLAFHLILEGDYALLGSLFVDDMKGEALPYRFDTDAEEWVPMQKLVPFDGADQTRFGRNVAIAGSDYFVGAPGSNGFRGILYIVSANESGDWISVTKLGTDGLESGDYFSGYLAANDDFAVAGIRGSGAAYVLEKDTESGRWAITATLRSDTYDGLEMIAGETVECTDGTAELFDCGDMNLVSFLPVRDLGGGAGIRVNDVWGWEDPETGREYALVGRQDATAFVDITDPSNPVYIGELPKTEGAPTSVWRDIKVYADHAFIVADGAGEHGMQVFDLTQLRDVGAGPVTFEETAHYAGLGSAHNIVINEETGYAYAVGVNSAGETCGGGLHMIDIREPLNPTFTGCFSDPATGRNNTGYSHDAQCIIYNGPDTDYQGHEICFGSNETALSIADVTDKDNTIAVSNATYPNVAYAHQGWVTEDHRYFFMDDEGDELASEEINRTRTLIFDISDLDDPVLLKEHFGTQEASDHNLYIRGNLMYQSNYMSGLRILDISDVEAPVEVGYFDTVPIGDNSAGMSGSWSNYPFFKSGVVVVTSGQEGLFVLQKTQNLVP